MSKTKLRKGNNYEKKLEAQPLTTSVSEEKIIKLYRLNKSLARDLIHRFERWTTPISRSSELSPSVKVLTTLNFLASGSYQTQVGCCTSISQPSICRSLKEVTDFLNERDVFSEWVHFPSTVQELKEVRQSFYTKWGFPGVIGAIDCTHVAIVPPRSKDERNPEHVYVNRKHFHLINVQLICDSNVKILNVNSKYPGSTHDNFIFTNSNVHQAVESLHTNGYENFYLIGDSGYALRPWVMTPLPNAEDETPEFRYNKAICRARSVIERCNGLLKMRFRCLHKDRVLHYSPQVAGKIINSCTVLHNMCLAVKVHDPELDEELENMPSEDMDLNMPPEEQALGRSNPVT